MPYMWLRTARVKIQVQTDRQMVILIRSVLWTLLLSCCIGTEIELHFTSNNCDEESRTLTDTKSYTLEWDGQIRPKLCSFSFTRRSSNYKVCVESSIYNLPSGIGDIKIRVKNYTRSAWVFDKYDTEIKSTCVKRAYKLNVSIEVPNGYIAPVQKTYLKIQITSTKVDTDDNGTVNIITSVIGVIFFIVFVCVGFSFVKSRGNPGDFFGDICRCCGEKVSYLLNCKCFSGHDCDCPSCDCNCKDIFRPCGECCSAWAGCCSQCFLQLRGGETSNQIQDQPAELNEISESTQIDSVAATVIDQPPSYQSVEDRYGATEPTAPPPSYEEVTGRPLPSAPKGSVYR